LIHFYKRDFEIGSNNPTVINYNVSF